MTTEIPIAQLAVLADCIEGVNMDRVDYYRRALRAGEKINPIKVCRMNRQGFYVLQDGNHRMLAHAIEGRDSVMAEIDPTLGILDIQWRWPRIAPVMQTIDLMNIPALSGAAKGAPTAAAV